MYYKKLLTFNQIYEANKTKENLCDKLDDKECRCIASCIIDRKDKDKETMADWWSVCDIGLQLMKLKYNAKIKPFEDAYNIQHPLLLNSVMSVGSRLYTEIHRETYVAKPTILGKDLDNKKQLRINNVKNYIQAVLIEYPNSNWLEVMNKMYTKLVLMGTVIKQIRFDSDTVCFDNAILPYKDVIIHNKSVSLDKAEAISVRRYLSQNDVVERINAKMYRDYEYQYTDEDQYLGNQGNTDEIDEDGNSTPYSRTYKMIEQHCWLDLDGDNYCEPYIATVDEDRGCLVRLIPRIDESLSQVNIDSATKRSAKKLVAEQYFTDFHYMPDADDGFWSIGLGHMLGSLNCIVNELMNNMANVATIATKQGGLIGLGGRNALGRQKIDQTKFTTVMSNSQALKDAIVQFDVKDPSPVIMQLTTMLIETGEKMGALNEALSGDMPNRDLPTGTMLMLIEQSMKNAQAIYRRIQVGLKKELTIICKILLQNGNNEHYQQILSNPEVNLQEDFDLNTMTISINSDAGTSSNAERLIKIQAVGEYIQQNPGAAPFFNQKELSLRFIQEADMPDPEKLVQDPPPTQPDPIEVEKLAQQKDKNRQRFVESSRKLDIQENSAAARAVNEQAQAAKAFSEANVTNVTKVHDMIMREKEHGLEAKRLELDEHTQNQQSQQQQPEQINNGQ